MKFLPLALGVSALALCTGGAHAQTVIEPDTGPGYDTGTVVTTQGSTVTITGGEASGANLFHSFAEFDLASGDIAQWVRGQADAAAIEHVINRVRSDTPSLIDGTIRLADMPNADFWFINPAGVIFGANAVLDVPGAAHFTSGHDMVLADGARFSTVTPDGSTFSSAPPQAFGFLGRSSDIVLEQGFGLADGSQAPDYLLLNAANIELEGDHVFATTTVDLLAVGTGFAGEIDENSFFAPAGDGKVSFASPTGDLPNVDVLLGQDFRVIASDIVLSGLELFLGSGQGGRASFIADRLLIEGSAITSIAAGSDNASDILLVGSEGIEIADGSEITTSTAGAGDTALIEIDSPDTLIADSLIESRLLAGSSGSGDLILITGGDLTLADAMLVAVPEEGATGSGSVIAAELAGDFTMTGRSLLSASTRTEQLARAVAIDAENVTIIDGTILAETLANGDGGLVIVRARRDMRIDGDSLIGASTFGGGASGSITLLGRTISLDGNTRLESNAENPDSGDAGSILVSALDSLRATQNVSISVENRGSGRGGTVDLEAPVIALDGTQIATTTTSEGNAGSILLLAADLTVNDAEIVSSTVGAGAAGDVGVSAGNISIGGETIIESESIGPISGAAGLIQIFANARLRIEGDTLVSVSTEGVSDAGTIFLFGPLVEVLGGKIISLTSGSGDAGQVSLFANNAVIAGAARIGTEASEGSTGNAGGIRLDVERDLLLIDSAGLSATTFGEGRAGNIEVSADRLSIVTGGIVSTTESPAKGADAGQIEVTAREFFMDTGAITSFTNGPSAAGRVTITADQFTMLAGRIDTASDSQLENAGPTGAVVIAARNAFLGGTAQIDSKTTNGDGLGGAVILRIGETLTIAEDNSDGEGVEIAASTDGAGDAGLVEISAGRLDMRGGSITSFTEGTGMAGGVVIDVEEFAISGGRIDSASDGEFEGAGDAGLVLIEAAEARVTGQAEIDSTGIFGNAGDVVLDIEGSLLIADEAQIAAQTQGPGSAGRAVIFADLLEMTGGEVTSASSGSGDAGNVFVEARAIALSSGAVIDSETFEGSTGNAGTVDLIVDEELALTGGSVISTTVDGGDLAGDISIEAQTVRLDGESGIVSEAAGTASAGSISIETDTLSIANGSAISTNSDNGPAGAIGLFFPEDGLLRLDGLEPGVITTSSGANTGGVITIFNPFLILSTGGSILALGEQGGANVLISSEFFIRSADRLNEVSVDGSLVLDSQVGEQIAATPPVNLGFLDASGILSGQCAAVRAGGQTSQFTSRITGPYAVPEVRADEPASEQEGDASPPDRISATDTLAVCL